MQNNIFNNSSGSSIWGIYAESSPGIVLRENILNDEVDCIYLADSGGSSLLENTVNNCRDHGIFIENNVSATSLIGNIITSTSDYANSQYGIYLKNSSNISLSENNINSIGIYASGLMYEKIPEISGILFDGTTAEFTNNIVDSNLFYGIKILNGSTVDIDNNKIIRNRDDIYDDGTNTVTYSNNQFLYNYKSSKMLSFSDINPIKAINDSVSLNFSMRKPDGSDCATCTAEVSLNPIESINTSVNINTVSNSFNVTKNGTYSLLAKVTDPNGNSTTQINAFFVDPISSEAKYYIRSGQPSHKNGGNTADVGKMVMSQLPTGSENITCNRWVQATTDSQPANHPLSFVSSAFVHSYVFGRNLNLGLQKNATDDTLVDVSDTIPDALTSTWIDKQLSGFTWVMNDYKSWYLLTLKLIDPLVSGYTKFLTDVTNPSYVDFGYGYTVTPVIASLSNNDIKILSASKSGNNYSITLDGSIDYLLNGTGSTNVVLGDSGYNFKNPFPNYTTIINSDGTAILQATGITNTPITINSVPLDIVPNTGSITTTITTWNTSGDYSKTWTESSSNTTSANHTLKDLKPSTNYTIKVDNDTYATETSDENGQITFNYTGGYSTHTFTVTETPAETPAVTPPSPIPGQFVRPIISPVVSVTSNTITSLQSKIAELKALIANLTGNNNPTVSSSSSFTTNLSFGSRGNDVRQLQIFLNTHGYPVSTIGPGSLGNETTIFGYATKAALIRFQKANNIDPIGVMGPMTRGRINSLIK